MAQKPKDSIEEPSIKVIQDGKTRTLQMRVTVIENGFLFKPGGGTYFTNSLEGVRDFTTLALDKFAAELKKDG